LKKKANKITTGCAGGIAVITDHAATDLEKLETFRGK
jgi:hypothetical protein